MTSKAPSIPPEHAREIRRLSHDLSNALEIIVQANYLLNPEDTNAVPTFRTQPGQGVMSVTDQYLYRGGISQSVPKVRGFVISLGIRGELVQARAVQALLEHRGLVGVGAPGAHHDRGAGPERARRPGRGHGRRPLARGQESG